MANKVLVDSQQNVSADNIESFYTSPTSGGGTVINAFTATNNTVSNKTYAAYIYRASGSTLRLVPLKILVRDSFDMAPGAVGHIMAPGDTLRMESSASSSVVYRVSGTEL